MGWRDIANATNARTLIPVVLPPSAMDNTFNLGFPKSPGAALWITAALSSFACDWLLRRRISGNHVKAHMVESVPVPNRRAALMPAPWDPAHSLAEWVDRRAGALSANTSFMAELLGYGDAAIWDEKSRDVWRTELDTAMFLIYGFTRAEVGQTMETFNVTRDRDVRAVSASASAEDWKTKRELLSRFDELIQHAEGGTAYVSPNPPPTLPDGLQVVEEQVSVDA